jgi:hypothetical protein
VESSTDDRNLWPASGLLSERRRQQPLTPPREAGVPEEPRLWLSLAGAFLFPRATAGSLRGVTIPQPNCRAGEIVRSCGWAGALLGREPQMTRILVAVVVALLLTNSSFAQSYCDQVRQAVATYGYAAAKRHAMATYSKREVEVADRCVRGGHRPKRKIKA